MRPRRASPASRAISTASSASARRGGGLAGARDRERGVELGLARGVGRGQLAPAQGGADALDHRRQRVGGRGDPPGQQRRVEVEQRPGRGIELGAGQLRDQRDRQAAIAAIAEALDQGVEPADRAGAIAGAAGQPGQPEQRRDPGVVEAGQLLVQPARGVERVAGGAPAVGARRQLGAARVVELADPALLAAELAQAALEAAHRARRRP
ncbi:MAG: hypothetical protein H6709_12505 [Kofleriaceae bacterium]|nr:hypothetical protein [Kofleriaceae bacterium]